MKSNKLMPFVLMLCTMTLLMQRTALSKDLPPQDFLVKGFHLDLRIQVMPIEGLKSFAKKLAQSGINTLIMEWEGTYPFEKHPLIANRFAYNKQEIADFVRYCETLKLDVIPLQQSFGHVEYILRHIRYKELREDQKDYSQINPLKEELAKELFTDLYSDLVSTHQSDYIHIGGDETYLLGHSEASKKKVEAVGKGRLYGDYIKLLCDIVVSLGKRPVLWADIAMKYPEALKGLPKQTVFVDWNYGWDVNMFGKHDNLLKSGFEIWGAPSIRSHPDNYFLTQWEKHFANIRDFLPLARQFGYKGMVMTSWSTSGLYSPVWETTRDIVDLYAIRRVYPIAGFNMLIAAYVEALKEAEPIDIEQFVFRYADNTYGLPRSEATIFWSALKAIPYEINQGTISSSNVSLDVLLDSAEWISATLSQIKPKKNKEEFEHYRLMADIRLQYLRHAAIERDVNALSFASKDIPAVLKKLERLDTASLDKRFVQLNRKVLYPAELQQENELRNSKIRILHARLSRNKERK
ncbi:beta-N-acetylhexosaminidase [Sphingobacterium griseoflavum]|nr:beta-N-acetylhexosaminidase [Sphingobacterium griseoflavum]